MRYSELATASFFAGLGLVMIVFALQLNPIAHSDFGPSFFPTIVGIGLTILGGYAFVAEIIRARAASAAEGRAPVFLVGRPGLFWAFVAAPFIYALFSPVIGFLVLTPIILGGLVWLASAKPVRAILVGVIGTLCLHVLFYEGLRVALPWGVLTPFAGALTWR